MAPAENGPLVYVIACEASGDQLGALLIQALRDLTFGRVRFAGLGGHQMERGGFKSLFDVRELSLLGVFEVLPKARKVLQRVAETVRDIEAKQPDILVTIDSWGFTGRVHERLARKKSTIPRVRYVAPQVWAWRPKRAKQLAKWIHHLMALLPFEPPYFTVHGLPTTWVGHPVVEAGFERGDGSRFRRLHHIPEDTKLIGILPGSRKSEVSRLLPVFKDAVTLLTQRYANIQVVIPTVPGVAAEVAQAASGWAAPIVILEESSMRPDAFAAFDVALAASGTVSLELAMARVPHVIAYRVNKMTAFLFRMLTRIRRVNLLNILLGHDAVPERLQGMCRAEVLADDLAMLLRDEPRRTAQRADFAAALSKLSPPGERPSRIAARTILELLAKR
ncbi:MAG: lipid-A-disaccharide synthase [Rhodospirillaceae bacterium]|nr:lipid-A-disaccharide synthase [Rhodospirillaceae bacterium]